MKPTGHFYAWAGVAQTSMLIEDNEKVQVSKPRASARPVHDTRRSRALPSDPRRSRNTPQGPPAALGYVQPPAAQPWSILPGRRVFSSKRRERGRVRWETRGSACHSGADRIDVFDGSQGAMFIPGCIRGHCASCGHSLLGEILRLSGWRGIAGERCALVSVGNRNHHRRATRCHSGGWRCTKQSNCWVTLPGVMVRFER